MPSHVNEGIEIVLADKNSADNPHVGEFATSDGPSDRQRGQRRPASDFGDGQEIQIRVLLSIRYRSRGLRCVNTQT